MENKDEKKFQDLKEIAQEWANSHIKCLGADGKENKEMKKTIISKFLKGETKCQ